MHFWRIEMAQNRIKGITVQLGADTTGLDKALKGVNTEIRQTQSALKDVDRLLKLDPTNTTLVQQKQKLLGNEIKNTKEKLDQLKVAQEQARQQLENGTLGQDKYDALQREIIETEQQLKSLKNEAKETGNALSQAMETAGEKMQKAGSTLSGAGQTMTRTVTAPIVGIGAAAVKVTADFDSQMSRVSAISGATGSDFDALREKAREMGAKTKFSATEAGQAMEYMAMAGWKTDQMLEGIDGVMNLAAASGEDLASVSDIVTDALTAFGLTAEDAGHFADVLAATATNANTNVGMMGESFKYAAPVAGSLGYSIEDVSQALGLMANAGIKADMAGTSLRNLMLRMAKPTKESQAAMDRLGVSLYDDEGKMYSLKEIMMQLRFSFGHIQMPVSEFNNQVVELTEKLDAGEIKEKEYQDELEELTKRAYGAEGAEKARAAAMLAGTRAMPALLAIANAGEEDYLKLSNAIEGCSYDLEGITEKMRQTGIDWENYAKGRGMDVTNYMQSIATDVMYHIDTLGLSAEESMEYFMEECGLSAEDARLAVETVMEGMEDTAGAAKHMSEVMQDNLSGQVTILKSQLAELAISFGDVLMPAIRDIVSWIQGFVDKLNGMDEGTRDMIVKIGLLAAAIGPVLIVLGKIVTAIGTLTSAGGHLVSIISGIATAHTAMAAAGAAGATATAAAGTAAGGAAVGFGALSASILPVIAIAAAIVLGIIAIIEIIKHWGEISEWFKALWEKVTAKVKEVWSSVKDSLSKTWDNIKSAATTKWENIKSTVVGKWEQMKTNASTKFNEIKTKIGDTWDKVKSNTSDAWDKVKQTVEKNGGGIKGVINTALEGYKGLWKLGFTAINTLTGGKLGEALSTVRTKLESIRSAFSNAMEKAKSIVSNAINHIKNLFNFQWSLPQLKLPHFSWNWNDLGFGVSIPSISVEWYAKAMKGGMILNSPTIFGMQGSHLLAGGEAGSEAVVGTGSLVDMIREAVKSAEGEHIDYGGVNINVYARPNMDIRALTDEIEERMNANILRRKAGF